MMIIAASTGEIADSEDLPGEGTGSTSDDDGDDFK
jgi:hypothetical protein